MPNRHNLTHNRTKISGDRDHNNVIQNISDFPLQWTADEDADNYYFLMPGDFLKVNYDIWVKSDTLKTPHLVTGTFIAKHPEIHTIYRKNVVKNKTYVQNGSPTATSMTTTLSVLSEFPELTIQKNKNIKISIRVFSIGRSIPVEINIQLGIKVNGVDHILSDSDKVLCGSSTNREAQAYTRTLVLDPIAYGLVGAGDAESDYTIRVKLSGKTSTGTGNVTSGINTPNVSTFGTLLPSARSQNFMSIIIEEIDR